MTRPNPLAAAVDWGRAMRYAVGGVLGGRRRPARTTPAADCHFPIVIIPGVLERSTFLAPLGRWLEAQGHPVHYVRALGWNLRPFDDSAQRVLDVVAEQQLAGAVIVAHSKGGLIGKAALLRDDARAIAGMVTVATPFAGSRLARPLQRSPWARRTPFANLFAGSRDVLALGRQLDVDQRIVSLVPSWDQVVDPELARLASGATVDIGRGGHFAPMRDPQVWQQIHDHAHRLASEQ